MQLFCINLKFWNIIKKSLETYGSSNIEAVRPGFLWWSVVECGACVVECGGVWWSVVECGGVWWSEEE